MKHETMSINPANYTAHLHPGKFEGEASGATEYFHEQMTEGAGQAVSTDYDREELSCYGDVFHINADEAEAFNLTIGNWFLLRQDSQGFAYGSEHPSRQAAEHKFNEWAS